MCVCVCVCVRERERERDVIYEWLSRFVSHGFVDKGIVCHRCAARRCADHLTAMGSVEAFPSVLVRVAILTTTLGVTSVGTLTTSVTLELRALRKRLTNLCCKRQSDRLQFKLALHSVLQRHSNKSHSVGNLVLTLWRQPHSGLRHCGKHLRVVHASLPPANTTEQCVLCRLCSSGMVLVALEMRRSKV